MRDSRVNKLLNWNINVKLNVFFGIKGMRRVNNQQRLQRKVVQHTPGMKYRRKYAFYVCPDLLARAQDLVERVASPACLVF